MIRKNILFLIIIFILLNTITVYAGNQLKKENKPVNKTVQIDNVKIVDANFDKVIRAAISKPTGNITESELKQITYLSANNKEISSIEGIQYCTNIRELKLSENNISDISCLKNLTGLDNLDLSSNLIENIGALGNLKKLRYLNLEDNQISDVQTLKYLTNLVELDIRQNNISDIKPITVLTKLTRLFLQYNSINDFSPIMRIYDKLVKKDFNRDGSEFIEVLNSKTYSEVFTFQGVVVYFNKEIEIPSDWSKINILDSSGKKLMITGIENTDSPKELKVSSQSATNGEYTLAIAPNVIKDVQGNFYDKEIRFSFKVLSQTNKQPNDFIVYNLTSEDTFTFQGINVDFSRDIEVPKDYSKIRIMNASGKELQITNVRTTSSLRELQINSQAITDGQYNLTIAPYVIKDTQGNFYDKTIKIVFNVKLKSQLQPQTSVPSESFDLVYPKANSVYNFRGINIGFNREIESYTNISQFKILDSNGLELPIANSYTTISKRELQIASKSITNGQYTLIIAPSVIKDTQGNFYDKEIKIVFTVVL